MCFESKEAAFAAVCQERDDLRQIVERQARMNRTAVELALELDAVKAERDAYLSALKFNGTACVVCAHIADEPDCSADCAACPTKCTCHTCDKHCSNFEWNGRGVPYGKEKES